MKKVKLLFIVTRCSKSGPINVLRGIIENIDKTEFEIYLITTAPEDNTKSVLSWFEEKMDFVDYIEITKREALIGRLDKLKETIKELTPDVIHSTGIVPDIAVNRINRHHQIIIIHSNVWMDNPQKYGNVVGRVMANVNYHLFRQANTAVACSESLSKIYSKKGLCVPFVRNGVNVPEYEKDCKEQYRKQLNLPLDKKIYVCAGSFVPIKNLIFLVETFRDCMKDRILLLLGDGELFDALKASAGNNIVFAGRQKDVIPYFKASDYYISASLQEGMPMAVLEGLSCGLPVVLSNIMQHEEILNALYHIGEEFENNIPEDLIRNCDKLEQEDYQKLSENAYRVVSECFNAKKMSKQYQDYYHKIAGF